jgi:uncharacterized DUF497 family protein
MESFFRMESGKDRLEPAEARSDAFEDAATVFADPLAKIMDDPVHSVTEERELLLGSAESGQILVGILCSAW